MANYLTDNFDEAQIGRLLDAYSEAYDGIYGDDEASMMKYLEEVFADVYAKIRRGRADTGIVQETMGVFGDQIENARRNAQTGEAIRETRGSPREKYSFADVQIPTYEELVQKKDLRVVDLPARNPNVRYADQRRQIKNDVRENRLFDEPVLNKDTQQLCFLEEKTLNHTFSNEGYEQIAAAQVIRELVEEAVLTHAEPDYHPYKAAEQVYTLFAAAREGADILPVKIKIKEFNVNSTDVPDNVKAFFKKAGASELYATVYDGNVLVVEGIEKGGASSSAAATSHTEAHHDPSAPRTVSVADLLSLVKGEARKYIPDPMNELPQRLSLPTLEEAESEAIAVEKLDTNYLKAVERGDLQTAQRMVDEAARKAGYNLHLYHGSKSGGGFTVFRNWQYFTENKAYAERYMQSETGQGLYDVYAKAERMFDTRHPEDRRIFNQYRGEYGMGEIQESGLPDWTDGYDLSDIIEENELDYDGIVLDEGGDLVDGKPISRGPSYVIRDSSQIKSAAPVTYDDAGNVIPLSERFRTDRSGAEEWQNRDIRYSMSEVDSLRQAAPDTSLREGGKETGEPLQRVSLPTVDSLRQAAPDTSLREGGKKAGEPLQRVSLPTVDSLRQAAPDTSLREGGKEAGEPLQRVSLPTLEDRPSSGTTDAAVVSGATETEDTATTPHPSPSATPSAEVKAKEAGDGSLRRLRLLAMTQGRAILRSAAFRSE